MILWLVAVGLIVFGVNGYWQRHQATHNPSPVISTEVITISTNKPDETPVTCNNYQVPADQPRQISLPSLNKIGCIQRVGIDQNNRIAVPTNIHVAGWYVYGPKPGESGVSIIDGHVQGRYQEAIFRNISNLSPGQKVSIQLGDLSWHDFEVISINNYSEEETASQQYVQLKDVDKQLTLITCSYDQNTRSYDKRTIVRTKKL